MKWGELVPGDERGILVLGEHQISKAYTEDGGPVTFIAELAGITGVPIGSTVLVDLEWWSGECTVTAIESSATRHSPGWTTWLECRERRET